jgi:glutaconate CoA-transferase subunit A
VSEETYPELGETRAFTKTGKPIYIRPLKPSDKSLIEELFKSLSPRSIFFRFLAHWKNVPPKVIEILTNIDTRSNVAMVALEKQQSGERVLGLCGILRKAGSEKGEFAVVVRDEWQGIGVGAKLAEASLPVARDLGMKEVWGIVSPENTVMIRTAKKLQFTVRRDLESGFYEMEMHFEGPKLSGLMEAPILRRSAMKVLEEGINELFMDPDPDKAREIFQQKSRAMIDKRATVKEAVDKFIPDDCYLAIGGFGANRIPTAVLHEIVRQRRKNLGFFGHTSTHDFQILCAGRCLNRVDVSYIVGLEARGLSPNARRVMESGEVQVTEWTNYALAVRLRAAAEGVSFGIARCMLGTDTFKMSAAKVIECPFTGKRYVALPAVWPDVAAIHVHEADIYGNCHIRGISIADMELARAAKHVIITTERLIGNHAIRLNPTRTVIPFYLVDAVIEVPYGSYPGNMPYEYFSDENHLQQWLKTEKDPNAFAEFLDKHIYGVSAFEEYLELCGGLSRMKELRDLEGLVDRL